MAKLGQILSDIELQVTAGRPTDDSRYNVEQAYFILNYVSAKVLTEKKTTEYNLRFAEDRDNYYNNRLLWKKYELDVKVNTDGTKYTELPFAGIGLPENWGVQSVYVPDIKKGGLKQLHRGTLTSFDTHRNIDFPQAQYLHNGTRLDFMGIGLTEKVTVMGINSGVPELDDLESEYPLSQEILFDAITQTVAIILGQLSKPDDVLNDGKDQAIKA